MKQTKTIENMMSQEEFKKTRVSLVNRFVFNTHNEYSAFCAALRFAQSHIYANHVNKALEDLHEKLVNSIVEKNGTLSITVSHNLVHKANYALTQLGRSSMIREEMSKAIRKQFVKK